MRLVPAGIPPPRLRTASSRAHAPGNPTSPGDARSTVSQPRVLGQSGGCRLSHRTPPRAPAHSAGARSHGRAPGLQTATSRIPTQRGPAVQGRGEAGPRPSGPTSCLRIGPRARPSPPTGRGLLAAFPRLSDPSSHYAALLASSAGDGPLVLAGPLSYRRLCGARSPGSARPAGTDHRVGGRQPAGPPVARGPRRRVKEDAVPVKKSCHSLYSGMPLYAQKRERQATYVEPKNKQGNGFYITGKTDAWSARTSTSQNRDTRYPSLTIP